MWSIPRSRTDVLGINSTPRNGGGGFGKVGVEGVTDHNATPFITRYRWWRVVELNILADFFILP